MLATEDDILKSAEEWKQEVPLISEYYATYGDRVPEALLEELEALEARLGTEALDRLVVHQSVDSQAGGPVVSLVQFATMPDACSSVARAAARSPRLRCASANPSSALA